MAAYALLAWSLGHYPIILLDQCTRAYSSIARRHPVSSFECMSVAYAGAAQKRSVQSPSQSPVTTVLPQRCAASGGLEEAHLYEYSRNFGQWKLIRYHCFPMAAGTRDLLATIPCCHGTGAWYDSSPTSSFPPASIACQLMRGDRLRNVAESHVE